MLLRAANDSSQQTTHLMDWGCVGGAEKLILSLPSRLIIHFQKLSKKKKKKKNETTFLEWYCFCCPHQSMVIKPVFSSPSRLKYCLINETSQGWEARLHWELQMKQVSICIVLLWGTIWFMEYSPRTAQCWKCLLSFKGKPRKQTIRDCHLLLFEGLKTDFHREQVSH